MTRNTTPLEDFEQKRVVRWLVSVGLPHFHVNNEMWTKSIKQKMRAKEMGVSSGVPDLFVVIPSVASYRLSPVFSEDRAITDGLDPTCDVFAKAYDHRLVVIEMKRKKGGVVSNSQQKWLNTLSEAGIETVVCEGADEAIEWLMKRINERVMGTNDEYF